VLPDLFNQILADHDLGSVIAPLGIMLRMTCRAMDGAYDTRKCHDAIAARNAHAVIPPRKIAKMWKPPSRDITA